MKDAWKADVLSVRVSATRKRLNGGRSRRALRIEKVMARIMYGETILKICIAHVDQLGARDLQRKSGKPVMRP